MRAMATILILGLLAAIPAGAATSDREKFRANLEKVAPQWGTFDTTGKVKALCVCNTSGKAGVVEHLYFTGDLLVFCSVPTFNDAGDNVASSSCYDWTPVTK